MNSDNTKSSGSSNNELIVAIDSARARGGEVKSLRKQKHDPSNFYMSLVDGKQIGPVKVEGDAGELNRKFGEAQSYLSGTKSAAKTKSTSAA